MADDPNTAETHARLADSASKLETSAEVQSESADRRTELAANRTVLAAERTYAAWVRTGLAALASGIGARTLLQGVIPDWLAVFTAALLVLFSTFCFGSAIWRQMMQVAPPKPDTPRLPAALYLLVNGSLMVVSLGVLASVIAGSFR